MNSFLHKDINYPSDPVFIHKFKYELQLLTYELLKYMIFWLIIK